jgi:hypothetical protein
MFEQKMSIKKSLSKQTHKIVWLWKSFELIHGFNVDRIGLLWKGVKPLHASKYAPWSDRAGYIEN